MICTAYLRVWAMMSPPESLPVPIFQLVMRKCPAAVAKLLQHLLNLPDLGNFEECAGYVQGKLEIITARGFGQNSEEMRQIKLQA